MKKLVGHATDDVGELSDLYRDSVEYVDEPLPTPNEFFIDTSENRENIPDQAKTLRVTLAAAPPGQQKQILHDAL